MKKILSIIVVAAVIVTAGVGLSFKSKQLADPGGGGLKTNSVTLSYDPGGGGL